MTSASTDMTRAVNEQIGDNPARRAGWSHDWQPRWSHEAGRKPVSAVPCSWQATWRAFFEKATSKIDILVYAAIHLHESINGFNQLLTDRARSGCRVRVAIGAADSPNIIARGKEETYGHGIESRCELALLHYKPLGTVPNIELRTHGTTLYNSIYRADEELMVNTHVFGVNAYAAPVWHLRKTSADSIAGSYQQAFEVVWEQATPVA